MSTFTGALGASASVLFGETPSLNSYSGIGDGVTDNRAKLQALINAVSANGGGVVRIPTGNYGIGDYLTVPANVWIVGAGKSSIITRLGTLTTGKGLFTAAGDYVLLDNFMIEGSTPTSTVVNYGAISSPEDTILTQNTSIWAQPGIAGLRLRRLLIQHTGGYSFFDDVRTATSSDHEISRCVFANNRPHNFTDGTNTGGAWTSGIYVSGACGSGAPFILDGFCVANCTFSRNAGNCIWQHSTGFAVHHANITVSDSHFTDCGLDGVELGNVAGGGVTNCRFRRIGYLTSSDSAAPAPAYVAGHGAVAIDTSGFATDISHANNTMISVNGYGYNLDGMRDSSITGGCIRVPASSDALYSTDSVSAFGIGGAGPQISKGIETGNTSQNGGAQRIAITGVKISGMGDFSISLPYAKFCTVQANTIDHPSTALGVPIELLGVAGSSPADEWMNHDNVITLNTINYAGANFCIVEQPTPSAGLIFDNKLGGNKIVQ